MSMSTRVRTIAIWTGVVTVVAFLTMFTLPTEFVVQQAGPVYNTVGSAKNADGEEMPLIEVPASVADPDESTGTLDLTTVQVIGNRENRPSWTNIAIAWLDPSRAVVPLDSVFPPDQTSEERDEINLQLMTDSQSEAKAAALLELGYDVPTTLTVAGLTGDDSPASGLLREGDRIARVNGEAVTDVSEVRQVAATTRGEPVTFDVIRDGGDATAEVRAVERDIDGEPAWVFGIAVGMSFDFPIDITIQLDNVGGPSAGTMFALGIIDEMTAGDLTGGQRIAGTGTITSDGSVGPIGGIRQKLYGARADGATAFLAPEANCREVVGHVPAGLDVFAVATLAEARSTVEQIAADDRSALRTCDAADAAAADADARRVG